MTDHGSTRRHSRLASKKEGAAPDQPSSAAPAEGGSSTSRRLVQAGADYRPGLLRNPADENAACDDAAMRSSSANSVGSSRRAVLPADKENLETQPTVITKTPPLAQYPISGLHPRDMGRLLEGERLGHYELLEYVGGGGMGAVFRSHDTMLNRTVAVKVLSQEQSSDDETLRRFQNEAQSAARLDHENISRVHYVGEDRGWHYIVFEFIEGINLRDSVGQRGPLPLFDAVSYTLQISDALNARQPARCRASRYQAVECAHHSRWPRETGRHGTGAPAPGGAAGERSHCQRRYLGHVRLHFAGASPRSAQRRHAE